MTDDTFSKQRPVPHRERCRTRYETDAFGFTECLMETPSGCEYAVRSVSGFHCYHPDRHSFEKANPLLISLK
jgi:hypothetical protein